MAYRGSTPFDAPRRDADPGIVTDMVRQFADPYAFLRELVQNAIDAGAKRIEVALEREADDTVRTSVEDDGSGMTRAIIEGPLLTLFSSSKESDTTKIGKYGIGFVSVFALDPIRVEVRTRRDGEAWLVRLFPDHSFELVKDARREGSGTVVTLVQKMTGVGFELHQKRCEEALGRWCRFSHVPIVLRDVSAGTAARTINEPLSVRGLVSVAHQANGERFVVSCGAAPAAAEIASGYYNRGLTLLETRDHAPGLGGVRFAIDSPKLSHTLSRDTVKQDGELRRTLAVVTKMAQGTLRAALVARIAMAAKEGAGEYAALLLAASAPVLSAEERIVPDVPLVEPIDGATTMRLDDVEARSGADVLFSDASTSSTRALARQGRAVVRGIGTMAILSRFVANGRVADVTMTHAYASPAEAHAKDEELARAVERALRAAGRPAVRVLFASFEGALRDALFRALPASRPEPIATAAEAAATTWKKSSTLFLGVEHAAVRLARRRGLADVRVAGHLLARVLLLASGPLDAAVVDALLTDAGGPRE